MKANDLLIDHERQIWSVTKKENFVRWNCDFLLRDIKLFRATDNPLNHEILISQLYFPDLKYLIETCKFLEKILSFVVQFNGLSNYNKYIMFIWVKWNNMIVHSYKSKMSNNILVHIKLNHFCSFEQATVIKKKITNKTKSLLDAISQMYSKISLSFPNSQI